MGEEPLYCVLCGREDCDCPFFDDENNRMAAGPIAYCECSGLLVQYCGCVFCYDAKSTEAGEVL